MRINRIICTQGAHNWIVVALIVAAGLPSIVSGTERCPSREISSCEEYRDIQVSDYFSDWHCLNVLHGEPVLSSNPTQMESGGCRLKSFNAPIERLKYGNEAPGFDEPGLNVYMSLPPLEQCPDLPDGCYVVFHDFEEGAESEYVAVLEALKEWVKSNVEGAEDRQNSAISGGFCQGMYYQSVHKKNDFYLALGRIDGIPVGYTVRESEEGRWEVTDFEKYD